MNDLADGTDESYSILAATYREMNERAKARLRGSWRSQLLEDVYAAMAETDPVVLADRLADVIATSVHWFDAIGARTE